MCYSCHVTSSAWKDFYCLYVFSVECVTACGIWDKEAEWAGPVLPEIDLWLSICTQHYILHYARALKYVSVQLINIHVVHSESQFSLPWKALLATERATAVDAFANCEKRLLIWYICYLQLGWHPVAVVSTHLDTKIHRTTQRNWIPRPEYT